MPHKYFIVLRSLVIIITSALCFIGCLNPRNTPSFKRLGEDWEKRNAKYTEEALRKSPELQELDRLCTQEVPLFEGFKLVRKSTFGSNDPFITYYYSSDAELPRVKDFYVGFFSGANWQVVENEEGGWGPRWHAVFRKGNYKVAATYFGPGEEGNYAFDCMKLVGRGAGD